jgi:hypothetical protein
MAADADYAMPIPPPSENLSINSINCFIKTAGVSSFVRMAIYDAENMAALRLVIDGGEAASDTLNTEIEIATAQYVLRRNGRYLAFMCSRGATRPQPSASPTAIYCLPSWLGRIVASSQLGYLGRIYYTRVNGAYPAVYNGVFSGVDSIPYYMRGKLV